MSTAQRLPSLQEIVDESGERFHCAVEHRRERLHVAVEHRCEVLHDAMADHRERLHDAVEDGREKLHEAVELLKPHLRGWLHAGTCPLAIVAGLVLVLMSPTTTAAVGSGVFAMSATMLFGGSALFHRVQWSPRGHDLMRRLDHANIFLLIAGTHTAIAMLHLDGESQRTMLWLVWGGAAAGIVFRMLWLAAPRWVYVTVYFAQGAAALYWLGEFAQAAQSVVLVLILVGGGLYSLGGLVYALQRPNPLPRWFGFHEVFHTLTVVAFAAHYAGISIATYSLA
ncbi:MAG: hemolysin III family protein [Actinomycetota bacterium]|nr:hemolysin III family protein [Actinomycetota bacterium]